MEANDCATIPVHTDTLQSKSNDSSGHNVALNSLYVERSNYTHSVTLTNVDIKEKTTICKDHLKAPNVTPIEAAAEVNTKDDSMNAETESESSEEEESDDDKVRGSSHLQNERLRKKRKRTRKRLKKRAAKSLKKSTLANASFEKSTALGTYPTNAFVRMGCNERAEINSEVSSVSASTALKQGANDRNSNVSFILYNNANGTASVTSRHVTNSAVLPQRKDTPRPPLYLDRSTDNVSQRKDTSYPTPFLRRSAYDLNSRHVLFNSDTGSEGEESGHAGGAPNQIEVCDTSAVMKADCNYSNGTKQIHVAVSENRIGENDQNTVLTTMSDRAEDCEARIRNSEQMPEGCNNLTNGAVQSVPHAATLQPAGTSTEWTAISDSVPREGSGSGKLVQRANDHQLDSMASTGSIQQRMQDMSETKQLSVLPSTSDPRGFDGRYGRRGRGGDNPFANVQVFSRQKMKKVPSVPLLSCNEQQHLGAGTSRSNSNKGDCPAAAPDELVRPVVRVLRDYSQCAPLVGPPRPGDLIAYKVLEMSADYQPVISDYKEAKVVGYDHSTGRVTLDLIELDQPDKKPPGRFDVSIEDDHEIFTNVDTNQEKRITLLWSTVFEPRLMINNSTSGV